MGRNGKRRASAFLAASIGSLLLTGCGEAPSLKQADIPTPLARAIPRLKQAGFDVEARAVGPSDVPSLVIGAQSQDPVLLVAAPKGHQALNSDLGLPLVLTDVDTRVRFDISRGEYCGRFEAAGPSAATLTRVLNTSGVCGSH